MVSKRYPVGWLRMTDEELGYSAAFFDAEGNIHIAAKPPYGLQVQMGNSYLPILEWFQGHWGGSLYERGPDKKQPNARRFWDLYWTGKDAQQRVLYGLLPHLRVLNREAEIALAWLETIGGTDRNAVLAERKRLRDEWKAVRVHVPRRGVADNQH